MTDRTKRARFYLDEDVPYTAAGVALSLGLDVVAARDAQPRLPQEDCVHLATAAREGRVMVTYNRDDYLVATREAFAANAPHAGLLILTRRLPRDAVRVAHALARWVEGRRRQDTWPMQAYEVDFVSY